MLAALPPVPESRRGRFFALRTRYSSLANFAALISTGFVLQAFDSADAIIPFLPAL